MGRSFMGFAYEVILRLLFVKQIYASNPIGNLRKAMDMETPRIYGYPHEKIDDTDCYWVGKERAENGIIVYLPGGGWVAGPLPLHWQYIRKLSKRTRKAVLVICYPLAPEHPYPAALNAIVNVIHHFQQLGVLKNWALAGDSAGGNLALATCLKLEQEKKPQPDKLVLLSPAVDLSTENNDILKNEARDPLLAVSFLKECRDAYVSESQRKDPLVSPIFADVSELPSILLQMGTKDLLVYDVRKFVEKLKTAGKPIKYEEYEWMIHAFMLTPLLPEASRSISSVKKFLNSPV